MRRGVSVGILAITLAISAAPARGQQGPPGQAAPEETELVVMERPRPWLAVGGLVVGGGSYGLSLATGAVYLALIFPFQVAFGDDDPADVPMQLMIPVVGSLIAAGDDSIAGERDLERLLYVDAGLQIGGALLIGAGFIFQEKVLVRRPVTGARLAERELEPPSWTLGGGPRGSYGLSVSGTF